MIDSLSLRLGELLLGALSQIERLGGDMYTPEIEEAIALVAEQRVERDRFEQAMDREWREEMGPEFVDSWLEENRCECGRVAVEKGASGIPYCRPCYRRVTTEGMP